MLPEHAAPPTQPHVPLVHAFPFEHDPQETFARDAPQLSTPACTPHVSPRREQNAESLSGMQPHTFGVIAPHDWLAGHDVPQFTVRLVPQLSMFENELQFFP